MPQMKMQKEVELEFSSLNPIKLGKEGYVLRIGDALEKVLLDSGMKIETDQKKIIATAIGRDILTATVKIIQNDAEKEEVKGAEKLKASVISLAAGATLGLISLGLAHYAARNGAGKYIELSEIGLIGAFVSSIYGIGHAIESAVCKLGSRITRGRITKLVGIRDQLRKETDNTDQDSIKGQYWKN
jgi:hypothetical protein